MHTQNNDAHPSPDVDSDGHTRKRVCKACDRCRLKKSKCDGASPCNRCQSDNAICVFGERKKAHDKVYPKGYVEMLEQQQEKLVNAIRELYLRLERNESWQGKPLPKNAKGFPLTHDILDRLGMLRLGPEDSDDFFEDTDVLMQKMMTVKNEQDLYPTPPRTTPLNYSPPAGEYVDFCPPSSFSSGFHMPLDRLPPTPVSRNSEEHFMEGGMNPNFAWSQPCPRNFQQICNPYGMNTTNGLGITRVEANPCLPAYADGLSYLECDGEFS